MDYFCYTFLIQSGSENDDKSANVRIGETTALCYTYSASNFDCESSPRERLYMYHREIIYIYCINQFRVTVRHFKAI